MSGPGRGAGPRYRDELFAPADAPGPAKTAISAAVTMRFLPLMYRSSSGLVFGRSRERGYRLPRSPRLRGHGWVLEAGEHVRAWFEPRRAAAVGAPPPWPLVRVVAVVVDVPVRAAGVPDGAAQRRAQLTVEPRRGVAAHLDLLRARALELAQPSEHMAHAALDRVDDRAGPAVGVRPVQQEHVRKSRHADSEVGARHLRPLLSESASADADNLHRCDEAVALEASGEHEHVGRALNAVLGSDAARRDLGDPVGDEVDVGLGERGIPVVGEHQALAADLVGGRDLAPELRVLDRLRDLAAGKRSERCEQPAAVRHRHGTELFGGEDDCAVDALPQR